MESESLKIILDLKNSELESLRHLFYKAAMKLDFDMMRTINNLRWEKTLALKEIEYSKMNK